MAADLRARRMSSAAKAPATRRARDPVTMPGLPADLAGPVAVALARSESTIPGPRAMPGGSMYELKWDGYRVAVVRDRTGCRIWSRRGTDLTATFPDLAAAITRQVAPDTVLDAEAVIWNGDRLDFDLLQQRMVNGSRRVRSLAVDHPASLVVFDLLADGGTDLRRRPLRERRGVLEARAEDWSPPLQLSPVTDDETEARTWFTAYRPAGIEGLVVKGAASRYTPGKRTWVKVKSRETTEVLVGGVTGTLARPESVVAGLEREGELVVVGRTTPLTSQQAAELADLLDPAGPGHPWPDEISSSRFGGGRDKVPLIKVEPRVVAEVLADTALQAGAYRHPLRYVRPRMDLQPDDLPPLP